MEAYMSKGINKWIGIGNCCADPECRNLPNGSSITNISVACNDSYTDKSSGKTIDNTEFVRVVFFNRLAEIAADYLRKGSKVYIEGRLQTNKWQDKNGVDRYTTQIIANDMQMLDTRQDGGGQAQGGYQAAQPNQQNYNPPQQRQAAPQQAPPPPDMDSFDDGIPF